MMALPNKWQPVLDYWFGSAEPQENVIQKKWFSGGPKTDREIIEKFLPIHDDLTKNRNVDWLEDVSGTIAATIVIDQFSRNLYRNSPDAFKWDHLALDWVIDGWDKQRFTNQPISHQMFAILPLVHSENLEHHDKALKIFEIIKLPLANTDTIITAFYSSAIEHRDIIAQFGRYPHRNKVLGRKSTVHEQKYLEAGAKRFGQ